MALFRRSAPPAPGPTPPGWAALRSACIPVSMARQARALANGVGGVDGTARWDLDLEAGVIVIGDLRSRVEVLGNESTSSRSFMFGWRFAELNELDPVRGAASRRAIDAAGAAGEGVFHQPSVLFDVADPVELGAVCSVLAGPQPYYRGPHGNGAIYVALLDVPPGPRLAAASLVTLAPQVLECGLSDAPAGMAALFRAEGFAVEAAPDGLVAERDDARITIDLDGQGRVTGFKAQLGGA